MVYEDSPLVGGLTQAATSRDPVAAIQEQLLTSPHEQQAPQDGGQMMRNIAQQRMQQLAQQQQQYPEERKSALETYQASLRQNPMGNMTPTEQGFYHYLSNVGKMPSNVAAIQGAGAGGKALAEMQAGLVKGDQAAARVGYDDVGNQDKLDTQEMSALKGMIGKNGIGPKDEEVRTVYTSARNEAAQIAKMYNFPSAEEAIRWIDNQANIAVESYLKRFAMSTNGRGQGTLPTEVPTTRGSTAPRVGASTGPQPPIESPVKRNPAEEDRQKEFKTGLEKGAIKDYEENIKPAANVADSMLNTIGMLKQIPRTQDAFAPWREKLGAGLQAIGADGSMVREAENLQQVRPLLAKIANDRLLAAKGVQTEGDAQRAYNEFLKITDTQKAADFMYAWTEELARRNKFRKSVWEDSANTEGTMGKASKAWENTDYAQAAPVAILNGKPWTYTDWRNAFVKANPNVPLNETIDVWNKLARGGK